MWCTCCQLQGCEDKEAPEHQGVLLAQGLCTQLHRVVHQGPTLAELGVRHAPGWWWGGGRMGRGGGGRASRRWIADKEP